MTANASTALLSVSNITKSFPGVKALDDVSFSVQAGTVHGLVGENGAGKSTLMKILSGVYQKDSGTVYFDGKKISKTTPSESMRSGLAIIYQELNLVNSLSVGENIFLGRFNELKGMRGIKAKAKELLDSINSKVDVNTMVGELSVSEKQMVEIAKALSLDARIIIMDEPTAALTNQESEHLYTIAENLRDKGRSIIFISHRFEDMYRLASRVTVFRDAKYIGTYQVDEISNQDLIKAMVGREISDMYPKIKVNIGEEALRVENLSWTGYFKDINFNVHKGEILGVTGLVGARRTEVMECIFGAETASSGKIFVEGKEVRINHPQDAIKHGIGMLTEDRQLKGLILDWGIGPNITLPIISELGRFGLTNKAKERAQAKILAEKLDVKAQSIFDTAKSLSGGNQQKVVVAKLLSHELKVLILDEPTKGVDVGAKAQIYEIIGHLAEQGYAIIFVSSEMPEILGMADRIMVMCEGRISGYLTPRDSQEEILHLAMTKQSHREA